ncbi:MAG: isopentenyl transferase family protein [Candidatus Izemoplasmatales bacterium]
MERIMIVGNGGTGKSTLAVRLSELTGLPVVHLDRLFWRPGWKSVESAEFDRLLAEEVARERWIIDGNYNRTMETRLARADTVVWLDFPRVVALWGVLRRNRAWNGRTRPDMGDGCPEKIDAEFLRWIWGFNRNNRARYRTLFQPTPTRRLVVLRNRRELKKWLDGLENGG